ncbi:hypothetical protein Bca4012_045045 [Brassica carinata]
MACDIIVLGAQISEHMVHSGIDLGRDLVQSFPLELLSLEELLQHGFSFILWNSDKGGSSDLIVLVVLHLRLIVLWLA